MINCLGNQTKTERHEGPALQLSSTIKNSIGYGRFLSLSFSCLRTNECKIHNRWEKIDDGCAAKSVSLIDRPNSERLKAKIRNTWPSTIKTATTRTTANGKCKMKKKKKIIAEKKGK